MATQPIYEFYAELEDYSPKIWRRFQVASNVTMARLGYILMTLFEMQASHLFRIEVPAKENFLISFRERYGDEEYALMLADPSLDNTFEKKMIFEIITEDTFEFREEGEKVRNAAEEKLKHVITRPHSKLSLVYDFGDNWTVTVMLEHIFTDKDLPGRLLPRVIEGEGYGIIEDCGGVGGLEDLAKAFKMKKGQEYNEYREWLGRDDLDLKKFDLNDMNFRLKKVPRIYSDIYELDLEPTERSMDILDRRYLKS